MFSIQKNKKYTMDIAAPTDDDEVYFIHFNLFYTGIKDHTLTIDRRRTYTIILRNGIKNGEK